MCSPAAASLVTQGVGAVSGAAGAMFSASTQKMGFKLDAAISAINADRARDNAREVMREGYQEEVKQRLATGMMKGAQRAAMGANGVDLSTGSALTRQISTDYMGEADAQTIRLNAARAASGYRVQASNDEIQGTLYKGAAAGISPLLTGVTSLLGSATGIASSFYGMKSAGAIGGGSNSGSGMIVNSAGGSVPSGYVGLDDFRYGTLG